MIVFSGGGEPTENLNAILEILKDVKSLQDVVLITSANFAGTIKSTTEVLDRITHSAWEYRYNQNLKPIKITIRISYDNNHQWKIPIGNVVNLTNYVINQNSPLLRVLIRTVLNEDENKDESLAKLLKLELSPHKRKNNILKGLPIIDGLPCRWLIDRKNRIEIPIIYKPTYFVGRGKNIKKNSWSYKNIIDSEIKSGSKFNLCLRGSKGEGHNYYETLFKGYNFWEKIGKQFYNSPKNDRDKGLALYLTADARLFVNSGSPDIFVYAKNLTTWNQFLKFIYSDPIQRSLIQEGPFYIKKISKEIVGDLDDKIDKANFVFSISYLSLETSVLRLYMTVELIQRLLKKKEIIIKHEELIELIKNLKIYFHNFTYKNYNYNNVINDPIIGNEKSLYYLQ